MAGAGLWRFQIDAAMAPCRTTWAGMWSALLVAADRLLGLLSLSSFMGLLAGNKFMEEACHTSVKQTLFELETSRPEIQS